MYSFLCMEITLISVFTKTNYRFAEIYEHLRKKTQRTPSPHNDTHF